MSDGFVYLIVNMQAGPWKPISTYIRIHLHAYSQALKQREALKQPRRQRRQLIVRQTPAQAQAASDWRGGCLTRAPRATRAHPSHPYSSCSVCDLRRRVPMHTRVQPYCAHAHTCTQAHALYTAAYKHMYISDLLPHVHTIAGHVAHSSRHDMMSCMPESVTSTARNDQQQSCATW